MLFRSTVAGQAATVEVTCSAAGGSRSKFAGDIGDPDASGRCLVVKDGKGLRLFVYDGTSTKVAVRVTAPAVDGFHPLLEVVSATVR